MEGAYPAIVSLLIAGAWFFAVGAPFPANPDNLLGASATVASVLGGFLGASKAIIMSMKNSRVFKKLVDTGYVDDLFSYLNLGVLSAVVFAVVSIIGFFVGTKSIKLFGDSINLYSVVWVFCCAFSVISYVRFTRIMMKLLRVT